MSGDVHARFCESREVRLLPATHPLFLEALGQLAVEAGLKVAWFSLEELGVLVRRHRAEARDRGRSGTMDALFIPRVVDGGEIELVPEINPDGGEGFFRLVAPSYPYCRVP